MEQNFSIFILSRDNIIAQGNKGFMDGDGRKQAENKNPDNIIAGAAAAISVSTITNNEINFMKGILQKGGNVKSIFSYSYLACV